MSSSSNSSNINDNNKLHSHSQNQQQQQFKYSFKELNLKQGSSDGSSTTLLSLQKVTSAVMLQKNLTFEKFLKRDELEKPTFEEVLVILNKKADWRNREDIRKLANYFQGLLFFENLKKDTDVDDDIINQCCKELRYRKYEHGEKIIQHGEEGNVNVLTPKNIEVFMHPYEVNDYIATHFDNIVWERNTKYLYDQYMDHLEKLKLVSNQLTLVPQNSQYSLKSAMKRSFQSLIDRYGNEQFHHSSHPLVYEFQQLTQSSTLGPGVGFGELALMAGAGRKSEKRAASIISQGETHLAILEKDDFQKVIMSSMRKKLDLKVEFFKNFRLSEGISRTNLNKLSYFFKEKYYRRRDIMYKEGELADHVYFIKEGEFEISKTVKTKLDKTTTQKGLTTLLKTVSVKVSIIGPNQIIGLEDLHKDKITYRQHTVQCVTEKAIVYYLTREEYYSRFYKNLQKHVVNESQTLKEPFFSQRLNTLQNQAQKESLKYLKQKERFQSRDALSPELLNDCKTVVEQVQNEELCSLLLKHKLLKRPQIRNERITSNERVSDDEIVLNDIDPNRYSNKEYFLNISKLYNQFVFKPSSPFKEINKVLDLQRNQSMSPSNYQQQNQNEEGSPRQLTFMPYQSIDRRSMNSQTPYSTHKPVRSPISAKSGAILSKQASTFQSIAANNQVPQLNLQQSQSTRYLSLKSPVSNGAQNNKGMLESQRLTLDSNINPSKFKMSHQSNKNDINNLQVNQHNNLNANDFDINTINQSIESIQKPFENSQIILSNQSTHLSQNLKSIQEYKINYKHLSKHYETNTQLNHHDNLLNNIIIEESQFQDNNQLVSNNNSNINLQQENKLRISQIRNDNILQNDHTLSINQSEREVLLSQDATQNDIKMQNQYDMKESRSQQQMQIKNNDNNNLVNTYQQLHTHTSQQLLNFASHHQTQQQLSKFNPHSRRQMSQTQLRPLALKQKNYRHRGLSGNGKNGSSGLTLEDIQAHLQQSQNSLIKLLEQRIKEKHRLQQLQSIEKQNQEHDQNLQQQQQLTQQQIYHQTIDSSNSKYTINSNVNNNIKMQVQLGKFSKLQQQQHQKQMNMLYSQRQIQPQQITSAPTSPQKPYYLDLPNSAKNTINIVQSPQQSNIYFNLYITKKRSQVL